GSSAGTASAVAGACGDGVAPPVPSPKLSPKPPPRPAGALGSPPGGVGAGGGAFWGRLTTDVAEMFGCPGVGAGPAVGATAGPAPGSGGFGGALGLSASPEPTPTEPAPVTSATTPPEGDPKAPAGQGGGFGLSLGLGTGGATPSPQAPATAEAVPADEPAEPAGQAPAPGFSLSLGLGAGASAELPAPEDDGGTVSPPAAPSAGLGLQDEPPAAVQTDDRAAAMLPSGPRPMKRADLPELDRRLLTLPGATIAAAPGTGQGTPLPAFSIFYVYDELVEAGQTWLQIGRSAAGQIDGWINAGSAEDWRTMLVMEYAAKGGRSPVLFFKRRNELIQFVRDPLVAEEAALAYQDIEVGDYDGDYFVAIEPSVDVDPDATYLMPILAHHEDMFDTLDPVTLVEVAGLNLDADGMVQQDVSEAENFAAPRRSGAMRDFRYGVVFAIDTTSSMGRYIDHTRAVVEEVIGAFVQADLIHAVDFGLVGYRDNTSPNPAIDYVTRIYQPLAPGAAFNEVLANFEAMAPVTVSTQDWDEDAFAGLDVAINGMDWEPYGFRMVILITDAGARRGTDPMAANPQYDVINILENAERRGVALAVMHLLTPEGARAGNIAPAQEIYAQISQTGDVATQKYFPVDTTQGEAFLGEIRAFAESLVGAVSASARGRRVERQEEVASLGDALVNEVFRAQLEYLGAAQGQAAPRFYRAWAADRDLADPLTRSLEVKVFVTRQQLSAMMEGAETILAAYEAQETGGGDFFEMMRSFAAQSAVEGAGARSLDEAGALFPSFLQALPYKSDFLALDADTWSAGGPSRQRELTEVLRNKLLAYRDIAQSEIGWVDLGAGSRAEDVYAVGLELLP
ncbi:MAG: hypothetical protein ACFBRM_02415, partial [Pikeienuella sp.]